VDPITFSRPEILTAGQAAQLIKDGDTVLIAGSGGGVMDADFVYAAIERRFLEAGRPKDLTLVHVTGIGDPSGETGVSRFAYPGLVRRVIGGHWGWSQKMAQLALDNRIEAYNLPQGVLSLLTREIAGGRKGLLTPVGLGTFVDPRLEGGKLNDRATDDLVEVVNLNGDELLYYQAFPINVAIIRGTSADAHGNISVEQEAVDLDAFSSVQAAYNSGGVTIAQVKVHAGNEIFHPRKVKIPGFMVSAIVVNPDQWQTCEGEYNSVFSGEVRTSPDEITPLAFDIRKLVTRRAALELTPGALVNLGFGISDGVANIAAEEGFGDRIMFSIEQGIVGGVPAKGAIFGAGYNPDAIIDAPSQFDFYHGGGLDMTFLGMAQVDRHGHVNVSKFGNRIAGCGGFIDISQNARKIVFCASFTTGGLKIAIEDGCVRILQEGKVRKFIRDVEQITFSGAWASRQGHEVLYVTERSVFQLTPDGLRLIEAAPGIDIERDVLAHMDFTPQLADPVRTMDPRIFRPEKMNLLKDWN